jgi:hypothetical protein
MKRDETVFPKNIKLKYKEMFKFVCGFNDDYEILQDLF